MDRVVGAFLAAELGAVQYPVAEKSAVPAEEGEFVFPLFSEQAPVDDEEQGDDDEAVGGVDELTVCVCCDPVQG